MTVDLERALVAKLTSNAGVTAVIGTRMFPQIAPQNATYPFLIYQQASRVSVKTYSGPVALNKYRLQLDVYSDQYAEAKRGAKAVCDALDGFTGYAGGVPLKVLGAFQEDESDEIDDPIRADEQAVHRVSIDLTIWYNAA